MARVVPAKAKKREGFQSSSSGAKAEKKKYQSRECSHPYCESIAQRGGLCGKHGVKCSAEGCWRQVKQGGVCIFHGAVVNRKECEMEGCATLAQAYGYCSKHGGYRRCKQDGCEKKAQKGGLCIAHFKSQEED